MPDWVWIAVLFVVTLVFLLIADWVEEWHDERTEENSQ